MATYSITEVCPHDVAEIRVLNVTCGCETTVIMCVECGKKLSEPQIDC